MLDGRYEMLERIGEGGMGVVYKAKQLSIDRIVAIKMLNKQMARDPNWVKRFNNEAKACSQLQHPNTIRLFDFGETHNGQLFMAMEYLAGQSLREAISEGAPMSPVRVLKILIQCNASLAEAHSFQIIHRDIKPDNVFLLNLAGSPDFVKLLDFSVAKLLQENEGMRTQAGVVFGTPQYMSPEQGRGLPLSPRSDLYALGILAYEMLTGRVPFTDENPMMVLNMHLRQPVPPLPSSVPQPVQQIVMRALAKKPEDRYQNATEMMQHCQQVFAQLGAQSAGLMAPSHQPPHMSGGPPPPVGPPPTQPAHSGSGPAYNRAQSAHAHAAPDQRTVIGEPLPEIPRSVPEPASSVPQQKTMIAMGGDLPGGPAPLKTVIATGGLPPPGAGPPPMSGGGPPSMPGSGPPPAGGPPPPAKGPHGGPAEYDANPKTMMLSDSEGIVSFGEHGGSANPAPPTTGESTNITRVDGATPLFWIICLAVGLGVGVLAYLAVLQLGK